MTLDHHHVTEARDRGRFAYWAGVPYSDCPYLAETKEAQEWKNSWLAAKEDDRDTCTERRQARCNHVWKHESIIQPGGRGYSTSWCRKCNITAHEHARRAADPVDISPVPAVSVPNTGTLPGDGDTVTAARESRAAAQSLNK